MFYVGEIASSCYSFGTVRMSVEVKLMNEATDRAAECGDSVGTVSQVSLNHTDLRFCSGLSEAPCRPPGGVEETGPGSVLVMTPVSHISHPLGRWVPNRLWLIPILFYS